MNDTSQDKKSRDDGPAPKTKKRDRSASEERLLLAGLETFSKYGFSGSTTKMIAKKADVNESLIGRYFDGKEGLLIAIIEKFLNEIRSRELPYSPHDNLKDELTAYVKDRLEQGCLHEEFARIVFTQALVDRKFKKKVLETVPMQLDVRLIERVQRLEKMGRIKPQSNVDEICQELDTFMNGLFFFEHILHETPKEELSARATRFVARYADYQKMEP